MYPPASGPKYAPVRFRLVSLLLVFSLLALAIPTQFIKIIPTAEAASPNVVISQVYGGGGSGTAGTAYTNDYVELFNTSNVAVPIGGWSIQYGSATGQFGSSAGNIFLIPAGTTLAAGQYLTVKFGTAGTAGATFTSDFTYTSLNMAAGGGKVALVNGTAALGCGATATPCSLPDARIVDAVAYGNSNNAEGGAPVNNGTALNSTNGGVRKSNGCLDTDNNNADFTVSTPATGLVPRTNSTAPHSCGPVNSAPTITPPANPAATVDQDDAPFTVSLNGNDDGGVYVWSATPGTGISSVSVTGGQGTANVTYTVALQAGFSGPAHFTAALSDTVNAPVTQTVNIQVNPEVPNNPPTIDAPADPAATVEQDDAPFTVGLTGSDDNSVYTWSATPGTGISSVAVSAGQGTPGVTYTVTLQPGFSGTATFTASLSDTVNQPTTQAVNIAVTPGPVNHLVISEIYGGGGNANATYRNDYVELFNPTAAPITVTGWSVQYASATGSGWSGGTTTLVGTVGPGQYYLVKLGGGVNGIDLPQANTESTVNMSATAGKLALVNNSDAITGAVATCPTEDPNLVDFVGWGTANCKEGTATAPAPSGATVNSTAMLRKSDGLQDTNQNGNDFIVGATDPDRTAPIFDAAPTVTDVDTDTDLVLNAPTPRDGSFNVFFSEPVEVEGAWYDINCTVTLAHTAVVYNGPRHWIVTPDVNFQPGEQCTFRVFASQVNDSDLNDDAPNTDQMQADYTETFTVATGTAPPETPDVHLLMGNPSDAVADLNQPNNYLMEKPEFALSFNRDLGTPNWVSWHLSDDWTGSLNRIDTFRPDPVIPVEWNRVLNTDYSGSGFDRGHMVPNADRDPETSFPINQATFLMTNIIPQSPDNNQGPWANMENDLRSIAGSTNELYIIAGGEGTGGTGSNGGVTTTVANGKVTVPAQTWKVALVLPKGDNDISRVTCATRTIAVIMPNIQGIRNVPWQNYLVSVDDVEALTGYDFFENLPDPYERCVEEGINGNNPELDTDDDDVPDSTDTDDDNDGVSDADEAAAGSDPLNPDSTPEVCDGVDNDLNEGIDEGFADTDSDNLADCVDTDDDGDGAPDGADNCPLTPNADQLDTDNDGVGNTCDADDDGDGVADTADNCPLTPNADQIDTDGDGTGDTCDSSTKPTNKDQCKNGGWMRFNDPVFKNQGDCIQFVNNGH